MTSIKGFIKNYAGEILLPITRAELVKDKSGVEALRSPEFVVKPSTNNQGGEPGLMSPSDKEKLDKITGTEFGDISTQLTAINNSIKVDDTTLNLLSNKTTFSSDGTVQFTVGTLTNNARTITANVASKLSGISLEGSSVTADPTTDMGIANKKYVDDKLGSVTGALRFKGTLSNTTISNIVRTPGHFYVITGDPFKIDGAYTSSKEDVNVSHGDTILIDDNSAIVHIPSGDDLNPSTLLAVNETPCVGTYNLVGNDVIMVGIPDPDDNTIQISIPIASERSDGYLSSVDYVAFKQIADTGVNFTAEPITDGLQIGTLNETPIYTYPLSVYSGGIQLSTDNQIEFTSSDITIGYNTSDNKVTFTPIINEASRKQLSLNKGLNLNVWKDATSDGDSLITYDTFVTVANALIDTFDEIVDQTTFILNEVELDYIK